MSHKHHVTGKGRSLSGRVKGSESDYTHLLRPEVRAKLVPGSVRSQVCPDVFEQPVRPPVAQRTEQLPSKRSAVGSTPTGRAKVSKDTPDAGGGAVDHEPAAPAPAPDPPGLAMARSLDQRTGTVYAAFVVCKSGRERQMRRPHGSTVFCGYLRYPSFESAWREN